MFYLKRSRTVPEKSEDGQDLNRKPGNCQDLNREVKKTDGQIRPSLVQGRVRQGLLQADREVSELRASQSEAPDEATHENGEVQND